MKISSILFNLEFCALSIHVGLIRLLIRIEYGAHIIVASIVMIVVKVHDNNKSPPLLLTYSQTMRYCGCCHFFRTQAMLP